MTTSDDTFESLATKAIRVGHDRTMEGEHAEPIFTTSSYVFESAEGAAARFSGDEPGNVYSRYTNPTVRLFEQRLAAMEGAEACVATASGMSAILSVGMALLKAGDHVICSRSVFGTTTVLFTKYFEKMGVATTFVDLTDLSAWKDAINDNTRLFFVETPSNPLCEVVDVKALSTVAHEAHALLVVDNCFCSPALQQPLALGADIVIHSATKYLDGQGRCLGGAALGSRELMDEVLAFLRTAGPTMSAFNAWVCLKGLETLPLRMEKHCEQALAVATWLSEQPLIENVYYTGLPDHSSHNLAREQQKGFGGVLSFCVKGSKEAAWQFINATQMLSITANLGDVKTTIVHPATTTHGRLTDEQKAQSGITENLIRLSVGLEGVEDIKADLQRGLDAIAVSL